MNPYLFIKTVRNARNAVAINWNRAMGREFIPSHRACLSIETSSLCNLDCCFCAYGKKQSPKVTMSDELFASCIAQALDLGYCEFDLTPCTGDVFMDRHIFNKLDFLDRNPRVRGYGFFTNFTIPRPRDVERLLRLEKFAGVAVSVYGHDLDTFLKITKSTEKVYRRLLKNLELLLALKPKTALPVHIAFHPGRRSVRGRTSDLLDILDRFKRAGATVRMSKALYNNWGGYVTKDDVRGLPIAVGGADMIYKNGACVRLFTTIQIMATGIVNGCACRDADATLRLGDLHTSPLCDIVSARNPAYMSLIAEQQDGQFRPVCRSCDFYASIYRKNSGHAKNGVALQSLAEFTASLG